MFMRLSSVVTDLAMFFPSAYLVAKRVSRKYHRNITLSLYLLLLAMPSLVLVDHGHFQFNSAMLGLSLYALFFLLQSQLLYSALFFTLALNFKISSLFYALPVFVAFLSAMRLLSRGVSALLGLHVFRAGLVVLVTSFFLWYPCVDTPSDILTILKAIFPLHRGLYQL